jgi:uncharacterized protein (DUF2141 family)
MRVEFPAIGLWLLTSFFGGLGESPPPKMKQSTQNQTAILLIKVKPISVAKGKIHVGVFNDAQSFPKRELALSGKEVAVTETGEVEIEMADLTPGRYALAVFHDLNGNGKLDTNLLGVPTEPYGFSNISSAKWGSPDFNEAAFDLPKNGKTIEVRLALWKHQ